MEKENYIQKLFIEILTNRGLKILLHNDIFYIKAKNKHSIIHVYNREDSIMCSYSIGRLEEDLPKLTFIRLHNSYIINMNHIEVYFGNTIILKNKIRIPLSRNKRTMFYSSLGRFYNSKAIESL